jgi:hypothetical protein
MNPVSVSFISIGVAISQTLCAVDGTSLSSGSANWFRVPLHVTSLSFPVLLGHCEGKVRLRPAAQRCSASAALPFGSWLLPFPGTLQESTPGHLGAAIPRVRPG